MSIQPAKYNLSVQRRVDYKLRITIKNPDGTPMDLTGASLYAQAWDKARGSKYVDFSFNYVDRPNGIAEMLLTAEEAESLPCESFWDLMLEDSTGFKQYYLEGMVFASQGYTEVPAP